MSVVLVQLLVGAATVAAAFYAARSGARATGAATAELDRSARREEWFRRVQWAAGLTLGADARSRTDGLRVLGVLARSDLADADDLALLDALGDDAALDAVLAVHPARSGATGSAVAVPPAGRAAAERVPSAADPAPVAAPSVAGPSIPARSVAAPPVAAPPQVPAEAAAAAALRLVLDERLARPSSPALRLIAAATASGGDGPGAPARHPTVG